MVFSVLCSVFSVGLFSVQFLSIRGSQDPRVPMPRLAVVPPGASIFSSRSLPRASWSLPGAFWTLLEPPTVSKSLPGASPNLPGASRNRTGRPQNWSLAFFGATRQLLGPLKTNKFQFFELLAAFGSFWEFQGESESARIDSEPSEKTLRRSGARARGDRPASKLVPGEKFSKYIVQKRLFRRDKHKQS